MSAEGQAYVERYSPYKGDTYLIHLRIGMLTNDTYKNTLFSGDKYLAGLCRCSVKTVQRAREQMIEDGYLALLTPATGRKPAVYQVLFPEIGGHFDHLPDEIGGHPVPNRWTSTETSPIYRKESNSESDTPGKSKNDYTPEFEAWWKIYLKPVDKRGTFRCWNATLRERGGTVESITLATSLFANKMLEEGREKQFILNSSTFLGPGERWREYLPAAIDPETLNQAKVWDLYDDVLNDFAPEPSFPRPQNSEGYLLDGEGRAYYRDPMQPTKRRYLDDE